MLHAVLDTAAVIRAIHKAADAGDLDALIQFAGWLGALHFTVQELIRWKLGVDRPKPQVKPVEGRLLTAREAAEIAGPSFTARWFYRHAHELKSVRRIGRSLKFWEPELRAWLAR